MMALNKSQLYAKSSFPKLQERVRDTPVANKMINSANFFDTECHTVLEIGLSMKHILSTAWVQRILGNKRPATGRL